MHALVALLLAAIPICLVAQTERQISEPKGPNTLENLALLGPVHILRETLTAHVQESEPEGSILRIKTLTFSPDGRLLDVDDCDTENSCNHTKLRWDSNWVIEERQITGLMDRLTEYVRDTEGKPAQEMQVEDFFNGYLSRQETRFEYEPHSTVRTESVDGVAFEKRVSRQDLESNIEQISIYRRSKQLDGRFVWELDGSHSSRTDTSADGSIRISMDGGRSISAFDAHGRQTEDTVDTANYFNRTVYAYNVQGWLVERSEWNRDGTQINCREYSYRTDSHGNWIRKTERFSSSAMETSIEGDVAVREIEYF